MKKKILVVDDDRIMLKFISDLLSREGYEVETAEDGFSALNLLTAFTPDIIFFDLIMPRIDGIKLIKIVRNMAKLKDSYIVIISAAMAEIDFDLQDTEADAYIAKGPFSSMAEHIKDALRASDSPTRKEDPIPIRGIEGVYARRMTKELLLRNRHLETILESIAEGILEVYCGKVIYANRVAVSLIGKPLEKILAAYPPDLFDENIAQRLDEIFQSDSRLPLELDRKTPFLLNGRQILIKILPVKGDLSTIIIMLTDITDYKGLEMQLQHMQKMEAIGTIAAGVAHNFRNTLTEILVNSQLIHMNYENRGGLHRVADRINTSVKRGSRLVDGLLQFSRKQITQEFEVFNLSDIIDEIIQIIRKSFSPKIDIQARVSQGLWVRGDATSLSQALMNLCNNARDAMPDGGKLIVRASREGQSATVLITDTGEGMDRQTAAKCFDPFFTSKPLGKGTGLGLSTTFGIIKSHDGLITVDSQIGRGTTFRVQLPSAADKPRNENQKKSVLMRERKKS